MKPCPFCGAEAIDLEDLENPDGEFFTMCLVCGATGPEPDSKLTWNDRKNDSADGLKDGEVR